MFQGDDLQVFLFFVALAVALGTPALQITRRTRIALFVAAGLCMVLAFVAPVSDRWWPWLATMSSTLAASPAAWFVVLWGACILWMARQIAVETAARNKEIDAHNAAIDAAQTERAPRPLTALRPSYDAEERNQIRRALRDLKQLMTAITEALLRINDIPLRLRTVLDSPQTDIDEQTMRDLRTFFAETRSTLITRYKHGQDDGNEVWAVLGGGDPLNAMIVALDAVLEALRLTVGRRDEMRELMHPSTNQLVEAAGKLSDWAHAAIVRLEQRRDEIGAN